MELPEILKRPLVLASAAITGVVVAVLAVGRAVRSFPFAIAIVLALAFGIALVIMYRRLVALRGAKPAETPEARKGAAVSPPPAPAPEPAAASPPAAPPATTPPAPATPAPARARPLSAEVRQILGKLRASSPRAARLPRFVVLGTRRETDTDVIRLWRDVISPVPDAAPAGTEVTLEHVAGWVDRDALFLAMPDETLGTAFDASEWTLTAAQFRNQRPSRPLDGIVLALSIDDIAAVDPERLRTFALGVGDRMGALTNRFGWRLPVYLLVIDSARLAGHAEFFAALAPAEREAPWGMLVPSERGSEAIEAGFRSGFQAMLNELSHRHVTALQDSSEQSARARALMFPLQIARLREPLRRFVEILAIRAGESTFVRGLHWASSLPGGERVDCVVGADASALGVTVAVPDAPAGWRDGRWFGSRLAAEILAGDRDAANLTELEARRRFRNWLVMAVVFGVVLLVTLTVMGVQCGSDRTLVTQARDAAETVRSNVSDSQPLSANLHELEQLRLKLVLLESFQRRTPLGRRFGGYAAGGLLDPLGKLYARKTHEVLLLHASEALEQDLSSMGPSNAWEFADLYGTLHAWWLLGEPDQIQRADHQMLAKRAIAGAENHYSTDPTLNTQNRELIRDQVWMVVEHPNWLSPFVPRRTAEQETLLQAMIPRLHDRWDSRSLYSELLRDAAPMTKDIAFSDWLGSSPYLVDTMSVPGPFTRAGYLEQVRPRLADLDTVIEHDPLVAQAFRQSPPAVRSDIESMYARELAQKWIDFLNEVRRPDNVPRSVAVVHFAQDTSLLVATLDSVRTQVMTLAGRSQELRSGPDKFQVLTTFFTKVAETEPLPAAPKGFFGCTPRVRPKPRYERDAYLRLLSEAATDVVHAGRIPTPEQESELLAKPSVAGVISKIEELTGPPGRMDTLSATPTFARLLRMPLEEIDNKPPRGGVVEKPDHSGGPCPGLNPAVHQDWNALVAAAQPLLKKFPFAAASIVDADPAEVAAFFGPQGQLEAFYNHHLSGAVSHDGRNVNGNVASTLCPEITASYQRAARIRDALLGAGPEPGITLRFTTRQESLQAEAALPPHIYLKLDGVIFDFPMGPERHSDLAWSCTASPAAAEIYLWGGGPSRTGSGPWSLFRLLAQSKRSVEGSAVNARWELHDAQGRVVRVQYKIATLTSIVPNPCAKDFFTGFRPVTLQ
jgi:type VI secretion system protein ImpL